MTLADAEVCERLSGWLAGTAGVLRVAIDGPPCADPGSVADRLVGPLHALGRPTVHVRSDTFWRDASLRLEYGHEDVDAYPDWLDADALQREVLGPVAEQRTFLTSLRDPVTNRSTRGTERTVTDGMVLLVSGSLLLGRGLAFDRTIHLMLSPDARRRRTDAADAWTLPAFDRYDDTVGPVDVADVTIRLDRRHPAVRGLSGS